MPNLLIVGYGSMGSAILRGALSAHLLAPRDAAVCEPDAARRADAAAMGVPAFAAPADLPPVPVARVLLAVKPQMFPDAAAALRPHAALAGATYLSIMAGMHSSVVAAALARPVIRIMPNLAVQIAQGVTAIAPSAASSLPVPPADAAFADRLFATLGWVLGLPEDLMDAFTAVAGSGPAYLFHLAESMIAGAIAVGMPPADADAAVRQTLRGAAQLLADSPRSPAELRAAVTSKGGTTAAALEVLTQRGAADAMVAAIAAGTKRGAELSQLAR